FGFHAVLVYERQPASVRPFEEVREAVAESIANDTANATMQGLFRGSGLVTYPDRPEGLEAGGVAPYPTGPAERGRPAQAARGPRARRCKRRVRSSGLASLQRWTSARVHPYDLPLHPTSA